MYINDFDHGPEYRAWSPAEIFQEPGSLALATAVENDDVDEITRLAATGIDVNAEGKDQLTQLSWAFLRRKRAAFAKLLESGANPNVGVMNGTPLVFLASRISDDSDYLRLLLQFHADPNAEFSQDKLVPFDGVIWMAQGEASRRNTELLIDGGANLNHRGLIGNTPAMRAVVQYELEVAHMILAAGADLAPTNENGHDIVYAVISRDFDHPEAKRWCERILSLLREKGADFAPAEKRLAILDPKRFRRWQDEEAERRRRGE
ncbi:MAG: hypothetical protein JNK76_19560 [Planctomycetales bacterium]|nr:hypothetical protein [Planctomycetales bacterium]MBN8625317.1 hypothetical protein [Planctomycetota bacterium]